MSAPGPGELWQEVLGWVRVANTDRLIAEHCLTAQPPLWEGAAYHCQQAAEKLLKAFLVRGYSDFGKTHDLQHLGNRVAELFPKCDRSLLPSRRGHIGPLPTDIPMIQAPSRRLRLRNCGKRWI